MSSYIPSIEMRRLLSLILRFQETLTTRITVFNAEGQRREFTLYYRMRKLENGIVQLHGFVINPPIANTNAASATVVPEEEFYKGDFWLGAPKDVFKDYAPGNGKNQRLAWAATYEQEAQHPSFTINSNEPVVTLTWSIAMLESMVPPESAGTVDDAAGGKVVTGASKAAASGPGATLLPALNNGSVTRVPSVDVVDPVVEGNAPRGRL